MSQLRLGLRRGPDPRPQEQPGTGRILVHRPDCRVHPAAATNQGFCVIGGLVYRGGNLPQLGGAYVFGDNVSGNVWALNYDGTNANYWRQIASAVGLSTFGTDPRNGDILLAARDVEGINTTQPLRRLVYSTNSTGPPLPPTLADTSAFTDLTTLTPNPGITPYSVNVPFWSDNAVKSRWFSVPNTNLTMGFNPTGNWTFPAGTVWIKHFELQLTNGLPPKRIETRLLVRNAGGVYGVTYRWGSSTTNAVLVPDTGMDENFAIDDGGGVVRTQEWHYPGQQECIICHTAPGGLALGFNTFQLNQDFSYSGYATNQIQALSDAGYFGAPVAGVGSLTALVAATNTAASDEVRVRSQLAANCVQCHQPGGAGLGNWDARFSVPTPQAGIVNGALVNNYGDTNNAVIKVGSLANSILLTRLAALGAGHMPPLATSLVNTQAVQLISDWITNELPASPSIALGSSVLNFSTPLGVNPAAQALVVSNSGGGVLNWSVAADASAPAWLSVNPPNGVDVGTTVVSVAGASLAAGNYTKTLVVSVLGAINTPQTVTVNLLVDQPPVAKADSYTVSSGGALNVPTPGVRATDTDAAGGKLSAVVVSGPAFGNLSLNADGSFAYAPSPGYIGPDGFTYQASDGIATSAVAAVSITVTASNQPPVAASQGISMAQGSSALITLRATDPEGNPLTYAIVTGPGHGSLGGTAPNLTYTPVPSFAGGDSFTFKANDGQADSGVATVSITVSNSAPVQGLVTYWTFDEGSGTTANDSSGSGNKGTLFNNPTWTTGKINGALSFNGVNNYVSTPALNLAATRAVTVALWFNHTASPRSGGCAVQIDGQF